MPGTTAPVQHEVAMRHRIYLIVLVAITLGGIAAAHADEVRACDFKAKARCASGDARVTLDGGVIKRVEVNVFWCGPQGRPGYSCGIDSSRGDKDTKWSEAGGATVIDNTAPFNAGQSDRMKVTVGRFVSIDMGEAQSLGRCGAGAELPRAIVIPEKKGACRVWLGE
jgi:hypothetical protein